ncbi:hypothetical protein F5051DRAFT_440632 [Lentinula edodes]|nr:hypothetical protein F5051DRAFT_440632 [Lentinula edodes]
MVKKGKGKQRMEASGRDDDEEDDKERAPCERCQQKKIPCLEQVKCSYSGRPVQVKREGGPSGEHMAMIESQLAQLLADNRSLREATLRSHQYRRQDEDHAQLIAIDTRDTMREPATPGLLRSVSDRLRSLKRRRIVENSEGEEEEGREGEKDGEGEEEEEEEGEAPAPKKAKTAASEKGKEKEVVVVD